MLELFFKNRHRLVGFQNKNKFFRQKFYRSFSSTPHNNNSDFDKDNKNNQLMIVESKSNKINSYLSNKTAYIANKTSLMWYGWNRDKLENKVQKIINQSAHKIKKEFEDEFIKLIADIVDENSKTMRNLADDIKIKFDKDINISMTEQLVIFKIKADLSIEDIIETASDKFKKKLAELAKEIQMKVLSEMDDELLIRDENFRREVFNIAEFELGKYCHQLNIEFDKILNQFKEKFKIDCENIILELNEVFVSNLEMMQKIKLDKFDDDLKNSIEKYRKNFIFATLAELTFISEDLKKLISIKVSENLDKSKVNLQNFVDEKMEDISTQTDKHFVDQKRISIESLANERLMSIQNVNDTVKKGKNEIENASNALKSWARFRTLLYTFISSILIALVWLLIIVILDRNSKVKETKDKIFDLLQEYDDFESRIGNQDKIKNLIIELNNNNDIENLHKLMIMRPLSLFLLKLKSEESAQLAVGGLLLLFSEYEIALHAFDEVLEKNNNTSSEAYYGKAYAFLKMGKINDADNCIKQAINFNKSNSSLKNKLTLLQAEVFLAKKQKNRALEKYEEVIKNILNVNKIQEDCFFNLDRIKSKRDKVAIINALKNIGYIYHNLGDEVQFSLAFKQANIILNQTSEIDQSHPLRKEILIGKIASEYCTLEGDNPYVLNRKQELKDEAIGFIHSYKGRVDNVRSKLIAMSKILNIDPDEGIKILDSRITSDYEYASIVKHFIANAHPEDVPFSGWEYKDFKFQQDNVKSGFYYNEKKDNCVIVFEDTSTFIEKFINDLTNDKDKIYTLANNMLKKEISNVSTDNTRITLTGFGFGAVIAELIFHAIVYNNQDVDIELITFNSAGSQPYINKLFSKDISYSDNRAVYNAVGYLSAPDTTNTNKMQSIKSVQLETTYAHNWTLTDLMMYPFSYSRTDREGYKFSIDDIIVNFDPNTGCLKENSNYPVRIKRWPIGERELKKYVKIEKKLYHEEKSEISGNYKIDSNTQRELDTFYRYETMALKKIHISEFTPEMISYLRAYVHSNGEIDKDVNHSLMKFTVERNYVLIHSDISDTYFKRLIQSRMKCINKDELSSYKKSIYGSGYFFNKQQFFSTKNYMLREEQQNLGLSTATRYSL